MSATVRVDVADGVAVLTLDDPERRNALSRAMVDEIVEHLDTIERDESVGALVVTGAPPAFCAGAELGQLGAAGRGGDRGGEGGRGGDNRAGDGVRGIYDGFLRVARSPLPTVAAVNGAAVGAGFNLALACDVRLAARSARFDTRFLSLGLHPGGGHTWMLQRAVGRHTAAAVVLFGETLDGEAAARVGLAWRCVDDDALLDEARALAGRAASFPHPVARRVKETLRAVADVDELDAAVALELDAQLWSMGQPAFAERLAALQARIHDRSQPR